MKHLDVGSNNKFKTMVMECQKNENENIVQQNPMGQCQRSGKQRPFHSNNYFSSQNRGSRVNKTSTEEVRIKKNLKQ